MQFHAVELVLSSFLPRLHRNTNPRFEEDEDFYVELSDPSCEEEALQLGASYKCRVRLETENCPDYSSMRIERIVATILSKLSIHG